MSSVFKNWKVVLLSFVGATTFWFFNALNQNYNVQIDYPIEFEFKRDSVVIMTALPTTVRIDVSSGGWNLLRKTFWFNVQPIRIQMDNPTEISFFTRSMMLPLIEQQLSELEVNQLVTDTLYISIERKKERKVRLTVDSLQVDLDQDYRITTPILINPDSVWLSGPESFMDTIGDEFPLKLTARRINDPFDDQVEIFTPSRSLIKCDPDEVTVVFDVERFDRAELEVPIEAINFPDDSSIYLAIDKVTVQYTVAREDRDEINSSDFAVTADFSMIRDEDSTVMGMLMFYPLEAIEVKVIPEDIKVVYGK